MRHRHPPNGPARALAALTVASALLGGCAEMHRGAEAVGRIGSAPAPAAEADAPPPPGVRTVRPRGAAPRAPADEVSAAEPARPAAYASAVPAPRQIFDFHPAGSGSDAWRQPFVIDTADGPLAADVRRSAAELRKFLADQKAGGTVAGQGAGAASTVRPRCGEDEVAQNKPGCARPRAAAALPQPAAQ